ncbi:hypothetical protein GGR57DRAFT_484594 [Xylariaceae sp. FL1272]|nr:hypothetical protein GGR57DRAFT_484594 [Xylariaceae sp. FL1272]
MIARPNATKMPQESTICWDSKAAGSTPSDEPCDTIYVSLMPKAGDSSLPPMHSNRSGIMDEIHPVPSQCKPSSTTWSIENQPNGRKAVPEAESYGDLPDRDTWKQDQNRKAAAKCRKRKADELEEHKETIRLLTEELSNVKRRLQGEECLERDGVYKGFTQRKDALRKTLNDDKRLRNKQQEAYEEQLEGRFAKEERELAAEYARRQMEKRDRFNEETRISRTKHTEGIEGLEHRYSEEMSELEKEEAEWIAMGATRKALEMKCSERLSQLTQLSGNTLLPDLH